MTYKPSKVLIIGSGPIIIGPLYCHSERSEEYRGGEVKTPLHPDILHCVQDDRENAQDDRVTKEYYLGKAL